MLALLAGVCNGYPGSTSWQVLAPGELPAEHKMAKAFVVHLPIHAAQMEPTEEQRPPPNEAVTASTATSYHQQPHDQQHGHPHDQPPQGSLKKRWRRRRRRKYRTQRGPVAPSGMEPPRAPRGKRVRVRKIRESKDKRAGGSATLEAQPKLRRYVVCWKEQWREWRECAHLSGRG